jgi:Peroxisomal biogenesis factor 11 (PEX11)
LEHLQAALRAAQTTGDVKEQLTTIARQLGYFGYLTYDAVVWVRIHGDARARASMVNMLLPGQRHQGYHPEAGNVSEGAKNFKPFLASRYFV